MVGYSDNNSSVYTKYMQNYQNVADKKRYINRNHRPRYASDGHCLHKTEADQTQPWHFPLIRIDTWLVKIIYDISLQWRHYECHGVSIIYPTVLLGADHKKSMLRITGLCEGNSPMIGEFPAQRASNVENVSIWWRHHVMGSGHLNLTRLYRIFSCIISSDLSCIRIPEALHQNRFHSVSALFFSIVISLYVQHKLPCYIAIWRQASTNVPVHDVPIQSGLCYAVSFSRKITNFIRLCPLHHKMKYYVLQWELNN